jgi:hypothetical protein
MPLCVVLFVVQYVSAQDRPFLSTVHDLETIISTVPPNGDVNPYGVAIVPVTTGSLRAGNILVSNFNNVHNLQGTGSTIVQISPGGNFSVFATTTATDCPDGVGLTTALVALKSGFVIVGSLPTTDGMSDTATKAGCLVILDSSGTPKKTLTGMGINGPWDMTAMDSGTQATLFVTNVLNGTVAANGGVVSEGSIVCIVLSTTGAIPSVTSFATIASTFDERTDPAALVIGPTGVGLAADGTLFVADTLNSRIAAIPNAGNCTTGTGNGTTVAQGRGLNMPLGLAIAPNGNILTVNAGDGRIIETTPDGRQTGARFIDVSHSRNGAGTLFGLAIKPGGDAVYFVDDGNNTLNILGP